MAQSLVTFQPAPRPHEQPEPVIETIAYFGGRHGLHSRCRQLDRQRDAVEAAADLDDGGGVLGPTQRDVRGDPASAFVEQRCRGRVDAGVQGWHGPELLVGHPQRLPAGGEDPHSRRAREDRVDHVGGGVQDMFAVVEHQQP